MKVGIIGSGDVGQALGAGFANSGHKVMIGSREPLSEKLQTWLKKQPKGTKSGTFNETAVFGDLIVLATRWTGTEDAIRLSGRNNFAGKVVIDVTNPLDFSKGGPRLALGHTDSGGEQVQRWLPKSVVVKAFNTIGHAYMVNPKFKGGPPDMFFCGNDNKAKKKVAKIISDFGLNPIDIGGIEGARLLEPLCILWVNYGAKYKSWNHAFKLLKSSQA